MKEVKPLVLEELTTEQKLGLTNIVLMMSGLHTPERLNFVLDLVKKRSLGAVWVHSMSDKEYITDIMKQLQDAADYPLLFFTDAEGGLRDFRIGRHNTLGCTDNEEYAYNFGKVVGKEAKALGYNVVCNPVLDAKFDGSSRSLGSDKFKIAKLGAAVARGMHDAGVLSVAKHYPSGFDLRGIDSHMAESQSQQTEKELIETSLYPYLKLMEENLLDGMMVSHMTFPNIDPDRHPATLSKKVVDIIRNQGFDGFLVTDALGMMAICSRYGYYNAHGLAIQAGNDFALPFAKGDYVESHQAMVDAYKNGVITDERLNDAVRHIIDAQKKVLNMPKAREITEEEKTTFEKINTDSIFAKCDEGITPSISRDGKHFFAIMVRNEYSVGGVAVDTFNNGWLYPEKVIAKIKELFPNSKYELIYQFPTQMQNEAILSNSLGCEDVIFLTFSEPLAYMGKEHLTRRIEILINGMQFTNRISTIVHFGNPLVLENLSHIPRYILGFNSEKSVNACLNVLAGNIEPKGKLTYDAKLN